MADPITLPGGDDGQSIPAALAAPQPKKVRAKSPRAIKPAGAAVEPEALAMASVSSQPEPAPVAEILPEPVAATAAPEPEPVVVPEPAETVAPEPYPLPTAADPADAHKEPIMATTIENVNTAAAAGTDKAQAFFADANERTKGAMAKSAKLFEDATAFGKGNVEAMVESSKIAAKGWESMGQDAAEFGRKQFEEATAAFKTLASVKSPTEFMKLQGDFMRQAFDSMVAETSRSTETVLKLAGEVAQPISNRIAMAAEKMKTVA